MTEEQSQLEIELPPAPTTSDPSGAKAAQDSPAAGRSARGRTPRRATRAQSAPEPPGLAALDQLLDLSPAEARHQ
ncbi:MAG: hypothetical protein LBD90_00485, partial [Bifidobacteriaceae bacterium]|nr:hypothetical protein [Bifidobacteriaceae bacterium]